jgi:hypothetical protein
MSRPYFSMSMLLFIEITFETPIPTAPKPMIHNFINTSSKLKNRLKLGLNIMIIIFLGKYYS